MKKIIIELIEDEKSGGFTISSDEIYKDELVIAQGNDILDALQNFTDTLYDVEQYKKGNVDA